MVQTKQKRAKSKKNPKPQQKNQRVKPAKTPAKPVMRSKPLSSAEHSHLIQLYREGMPVSVLSRKFNQSLYMTRKIITNEKNATKTQKAKPSKEKTKSKKAKLVESSSESETSEGDVSESVTSDSSETSESNASSSDISSSED